VDAIGGVYRTTSSGSVHGCNPTAKAEANEKSQMATSNVPSTRRVDLAGINQRSRFGLAFGIWGFSKG
jgi:hypothetical protein